MDFSAARYFDEDDRLNAIAAQEKEQEPKSSEKETWIKRARYLIFG